MGNFKDLFTLNAPKLRLRFLFKSIVQLQCSHFPGSDCSHMLWVHNNLQFKCVSMLTDWCIWEITVQTVFSLLRPGNFCIFCQTEKNISMLPNHDHISGRWTQYSVRNFGWVHWLHTLDETALFVISKYINGKPSRVYLMLAHEIQCTAPRWPDTENKGSKSLRACRLCDSCSVLLRFLSPGSLGWRKYGNLGPALRLCR